LLQHKETRTTLAGDLITMADQDVIFLNNIILVSATKKHSERTMICQEVIAKVIKVSSNIFKSFMNASKSVPLSKRNILKEMLCK
jgi:uracil DNA glycosylase